MCEDVSLGREGLIYTQIQVSKVMLGSGAKAEWEIIMPVMVVQYNTSVLPYRVAS